MDKIYIVMNYVEHDLKSLMETMKQPFLPGNERHCWASVHFLCLVYSLNLWGKQWARLLHSTAALLKHNVFSSLSGEVKTLMIQLLRGVRHLHDNWILHRDLKTSNLLLSHKGILKVCSHCSSYAGKHGGKSNSAPVLWQLMALWEMGNHLLK